MSLECGDEIFLRDVNGANLTRFMWFHRGRWVALQREVLPLDHPLHLNNGTMGDWRWVLTYLMKAAKISPDRLGYGVQGTGKGAPFIALGPVVRVSELAALLGMPDADVRAELKDLVLQVSDDPG